MLVIFGLGNPGAKYEGTRHNAGVETLARLAAFYQVRLRRRCFCKYRSADFVAPSGENVRLVFPLTYMNSSGEIASQVVSGGDQVLVICDQMDLPTGTIRLKRSGSSAGHNGLKSLMAALPGNFMRLYIGVGRPEEGVAVVDHVLTKYSEEDRRKVDEAEQRAVGIVAEIISGKDLARVMQDANSR